jgi:hypothetical protein
MKKYPASELVEDFDFYPRPYVDAQNVYYLSQAIESGSILPPIVIEKQTKRIVDGFHRRRAHVKVYGPNVEVEVIEKVYENDAALLLDAAELNASHGRRLQTADYARLISRAKAFGIDDVTVAKCLHITVDKLTQIKVHRLAKITPRQPVPIKRTIQHLAGTTITDEQVEANEKLSWMNQSFTVNQLIILLKTPDFLDREDRKLMHKLEELYYLLGEVLAKV